jgi:tetratricopeptide (TPR) repeat protein
MPYDLFVSYARRDNENGRVSQLVDRIGGDFESFAGRPLRIFFDQDEIRGMDDWRQKIQQSLRESHLFLAILSPGYLASQYCRWEWEDYVRYEAMRQCLGEGVAPVFFVTLPEAAGGERDRAVADWIKDIQDRQTFDMRPWHAAGEQALRESHVKTTLEQLQASVYERLDRSERARRSPDNLIRHNPAFVGRVRELSELRGALTKNKLGVVGASDGIFSGRATVQGLGGMGKTELALAYAHAFAWDYPGGRWQIACEHIGDLRVALLQLSGARALNFEFSEDESKNIELGFERMLRELDKRERCLLVLDNISEPAILEPEYLDRLPRDGRVDIIATTRLAPRSIPGSVEEQTFISVDELPEEDALALLRGHQPGGRFPDQEEDDHAREIARLLEGFTLAVETAGIYLGRHTGEVTCGQFLEELRARLLEHSEEAAGDSTVAVRHRERLLEKTLAFTLETLSPEVLHILNLAALLPADQIALPWLQSVGAEQFPAFAGSPEVPNPAFRQTSELLLGLRLFQSAGVMDADGRLLIVRIHRLVQALLRKHAGDGDEIELETGLSANDPIGLPEMGEIQVIRISGDPMREITDFERSQYNLEEYVALRAEYIQKHWQMMDERWEIAPLHAAAVLWLEHGSLPALRIAVSINEPLLRLARQRDAEDLLAKALSIGEQHFNSTHRALVPILASLGEVLVAKGNYEEAEDLLRRALSVTEKRFGQEDPKLAPRLNDLAAVMMLMNRAEEAEPLYWRALGIVEAGQGKGGSDLLPILLNLGEMLRGQNRVAEAEPLLRRALEIAESSNDPNDLMIASAANNLALLLRTDQRRAEAEQFYRRALAISEAKLGAENPSVAKLCNNLGVLLYLEGRFDEAEPLLLKALGIHEASLDLQHPDIGQDLNNLATLYLATGLSYEAELLFGRALKIQERNFGPNHPEVAKTVANLGMLLKGRGQISEAESMLRRALTILESSFPANHPEVLAVLNNLAGLLKKAGSLAEAAELYQRFLVKLEGAGPDDPAVGDIACELGKTFHALQRFDEAEPHLRTALAIHTTVYGSLHPDVAMDLNNLAGLVYAKNHLNEAEVLFLAAIVCFEGCFGPDDPNVALPVGNLSHLYMQKNQLSEAEALAKRYLILLTRFTRGSGEQHPQLYAALAHYAAILDKMGLSEIEVQVRTAAAVAEGGLRLAKLDNV